MIVLARAVGILIVSALAAQTPPEPAPSGGGGASGQTQTAKPAGQEDAASAPKARSPEMQVSRADAAAGENERN